MKTTIVMLLLLIAGSAATCQNGTSSKPFKITISTKTPTVQPGSPVLITISFTNTSDKDIDASSTVYGFTGLDVFFQYKVTDAAGNPIAKRIYKHPELAGGRPIMGRIVKPGETLTEEQDISRLFDIEKPGKHIIEASKNLANGEPDQGVKSNKLTVTVVSPSQPTRDIPK